MAITTKVLSFGTNKVGTIGGKLMGIDPYLRAKEFILVANITDFYQKQAINYLVKELIDNNLMNKFSFIYPFVGGDATRHSYNLVNTNLFQLAFSGGWVHNSNGINPNSANTWGNTNCTPLSISSGNNIHISYYSLTNSSTSFEHVMGVYDGSRALSLRIRESVDNRAYGFFRNTVTNQPFFNNNTPSTGLHIINTTSATSRQLIKNGVILNENTATDTYLAPNRPLYIGAVNFDGSPLSYTGKVCSFASGGLGLTNPEWLIFNTIVNNFQTILGRNV